MSFVLYREKNQQLVLVKVTASLKPLLSTCSSGVNLWSLPTQLIFSHSLMWHTGPSLRLRKYQLPWAGAVIWCWQVLLEHVVKNSVFFWAICQEGIFCLFLLKKNKSNMIMNLIKVVCNDLIRFLALRIFVLARDLSVFYRIGWQRSHVLSNFT